MKNILLITVLITCVSCSSNRTNIQTCDFSKTKFLCLWAYGDGGDTPLELKYFNSVYLDNSAIELMFNTSNIEGRLYWVLYAKYRARKYYDEFKKVCLLEKDKIIEFRDGCKFSKISVSSAVEKIEYMRYDWAGAPAE